MQTSFTPSPEMIDAISDWHQRQPADRDHVHRPLVPHLRERFGLNNVQAIAVIRAANMGGADASGS